MGRLYIIIIAIGIQLSSMAQVWKPLDGGIGGAPTAISADGKLLATAHITGFEKGYRMHEISIWNGYYWLRLPTIYADSFSVISALKFYKGGLYIAGKINQVAGLPDAKHIIRWQNREYHDLSEVSSKLSNLSSINQLNVFNNQLIISGLFVASSVQYGDNLAFYNGTSLITATTTAFGSGIKGTLSTTYSNGDNIIAFGGRLLKVNDTTAYQMAYLLDGTWTRIDDIGIVPNHITSTNNQIIFSGYTIDTKQLGFYRVKNNIIDTIENGLSQITDVYSIVSLGSKIYASGNFYITDDKDPVNLIVFENNEWKPLVNGDLNGPRRLATYKGSLIASGLFVYHKGLLYNRIAEYLPEHGIIAGKVYFDKDKNCKFNSRDEYLSNMLIYISPGDHYLKPLDDGSYIKFLPKGEYSVSIKEKDGWDVVNCSSSTLSMKLNAGDFLMGVNFPMVQKTGIRDLAINLSSSSGWSVDKNQKIGYTIHYENKGSENVSSTQVVLHYDSKLVNLNAEPSPAINQGDSAVWNVTDLFAGESREIYFTFNVDNSVVNPITLSAKIALQEDEEITIDNESHLEQSLNEGDYEFKKEVYSAQGDTAYISDSTDFIEYQISFANYTNDTIFNVYVIDTIRLNHSLSIIQTTGASHAVSSEAFPGLPGEDLGIIVWTFKDINLYPNPTKNPEIVTHKGYVSFKLGIKQNLNQGTVLTNRGNVVFDYYEEEATNWVYCIVDNQLAAVEETDVISKEFDVYPNPVQSILNLNLNEFKNQQFDYSIYSISGEMVQSGHLIDSQINVAGLASGLYFLRLNDGQHLYTKRILKTH